MTRPDPVALGPLEDVPPETVLPEATFDDDPFSPLQAASHKAAKPIKKEHLILWFMLVLPERLFSIAILRDYESDFLWMLESVERLHECRTPLSCVCVQRNPSRHPSCRIPLGTRRCRMSF